MYAVIRVRGQVNVTPDKKKAMEMLNLNRNHNMSVWQESMPALKSIKSAEGFITWGKISEEMLTKVVEKKGKMVDVKADVKKAIAEVKKGKTLNQAGIVNCFRMSAPKKGFERGGTRLPFKMGGALGDRKEEINELIERML